jgi:hypothetical protein
VSASPSPRGRVHQRPFDVTRRHGDRGRQEPHRGARRGRGVGGPATARRREDSFDHGQPRCDRPYPVRLRPPACSSSTHSTSRTATSPTGAAPSPATPSSPPSSASPLSSVNLMMAIEAGLPRAS